MNAYNTLADDFYQYMYLNTQLELPSNRDTVLHFFEQISKRYPKMGNFSCRDTDEFMLEEEKEAGSYRWVNLDDHQLSSGFFNPPQIEDAFALHEMVLDAAPHTLSLSRLDCESLDAMFGFDFAYKGNHDEVVAQAFGMETRFESLFRMPNTKTISFEPNFIIALDEQCRLQARLRIVTRTSSYQIRTQQFGDESISVYFTVRQYGGAGMEGSFIDSFRRQVEIGQEMLDNHIIPNVIQPLAEAIGTR